MKKQVMNPDQEQGPGIMNKMCVYCEKTYIIFFISQAVKNLNNYSGREVHPECYPIQNQKYDLSRYVALSESLKWLNRMIRPSKTGRVSA